MCVCVCVCVCVFTHMHACRQGRGGLCLRRAPVRAGIAPGLLSEGGAGRLAGRVGPQLCQPLSGVTQARSRKQDDSGGKSSPPPFPQPTQDREGVAQRPREPQLQKRILMLEAHLVGLPKT